MVKSITKTRKRTPPGGGEIPVPPTNEQLGYPITLLKGGSFEGTPNARAKGDLPMILPPSWKKVYSPPVRTSMIPPARTCKRKFFLQNKVGAMRKGSWRVPLVMGRVVHKIFEERFKGKTFQEAVDRALAKIIKPLLVQLKSSVNSLGLLPDGKTLGDSETRLLESFWKACSTAHQGIQESEDLFKEYTLVSSEEKVYFRVKDMRSGKSVPAPLASRVDLLLRDRNGHLWLLDYKTTSFSPLDVAGVMGISIQPQVYRLGVMASRPRDHVVGVMFLIVKKCTLKFCGKDKGIFGAYLERCQVWYEEQKEKSVTPGQEHLAPVVYTRNRFTDRFPSAGMLSSLVEVARLRNKAPLLENFPECGDPLTCIHPWMGQCPYVPLCTSPRSQWPNILERNYVQGHREEEDQNEEG